jgi:hypothetical protein
LAKKIFRGEEKNKEYIFTELLRELVATFVTFDRAYHGLIDRIPKFDEANTPEPDPLIDPLALSCLDAAYAFKEILKTGSFDFCHIPDSKTKLQPLDRTRARKRHPHKFIPNTLNAGDSCFSGLNIFYGIIKDELEFPCRLILLDGAQGSGKICDLIHGFYLEDGWDRKKQVVLFVGTAKPVNLTILLFDFHGIIKDLLAHIKSQNKNTKNFLNTVLEIENLLGKPRINTFNYTFKKSS